MTGDVAGVIVVRGDGMNVDEAGGAQWPLQGRRSESARDEGGTGADGDSMWLEESVEATGSKTVKVKVAP